MHNRNLDEVPLPRTPVHEVPFVVKVLPTITLSVLTVSGLQFIMAPEGEDRLDAAVVELYPLAYPVRPASDYHHLLPLRRLGGSIEGEDRDVHPLVQQVVPIRG